MTFTIEPIVEKDFLEVVIVWEASVRATHHFLKEEDINFFKPLILHRYLYDVELNGVRDEENRILGFLGTSQDHIEMLFLHPEAIGKGIGKALILFAKDHLHARLVDVNEQNEAAVGFYKHMGFKVYKRSPLDGLGKPYPILHMQL